MLQMNIYQPGNQHYWCISTKESILAPCVLVCLVWIFVALVNVKARVISLSYPLQQLKSPPQPEWPIVNGLRQPIWDTGTSLCPLPLFLWTHNKVVSLSGATDLNRSNTGDGKRCNFNNPSSISAKPKAVLFNSRQQTGI